jgi:predicted RNA-binding Zn ribbon-like protein
MPQVARSSVAAGRSGAAPGDLEKVRALVNSSDLEQGTDDLATTGGLASWLQHHGLTAASDSAAFSRTDLEQAVALREALRGVLRTHAARTGAGAVAGPAPAAEDPVTELRRIAAGLATRFEVNQDGRIGVAPAGSGGPAALARILLIAATAAAAGTWSRLKACAADDCQWAFYDRSPTRTGCWCSMRVCGARAKSRAYRQRASGAGGSAPVSPAPVGPAPGGPASGGSAPGGSAPGGSAPVSPDAAPTARSSHGRTAR